MTPIDIFNQCVLGSLDDFSEQFDSCLQAFRLELLPSYAEESEAKYLKLFNAGQNTPPTDFNSEWISTLSRAKERGAKYTRVRLRPSATLNSYMSFEYEWGYRKNADYGERIIQIHPEDLEKIKETLGFLIDYWLFDNRQCFLMIYDVEGQFLGVVKLNAIDNIDLFIRTAELAIKIGEPVSWT